MICLVQYKKPLKIYTDTGNPKTSSMTEMTGTNTGKVYTQKDVSDEVYRKTKEQKIRHIEENSGVESKG